MMAVEINIARQLTYFAGREKDEGKRCDLEAGMAKLLGRPRRLGRRRQRAADPRRQRLRARIPDQPRPLRRPHPLDLRGRGGDPGAGDRPAFAGRRVSAPVVRRSARRSATRAAGCRDLSGERRGSASPRLRGEGFDPEIETSEAGVRGRLRKRRPSATQRLVRDRPLTLACCAGLPPPQAGCSRLAHQRTDLG